MLGVHIYSQSKWADQKRLNRILSITPQLKPIYTPLEEDDVGIKSDSSTFHPLTKRFTGPKLVSRTS